MPPLLDVSDGGSWRVLERQVQAARAQADQTEIGRIVVDERSARCDQRFLSLFHDADQRRLLFATPDREPGPLQPLSPISPRAVVTENTSCPHRF